MKATFNRIPMYFTGKGAQVEYCDAITEHETCRNVPCSDCMFNPDIQENRLEFDAWNRPLDVVKTEMPTLSIEDIPGANHIFDAYIPELEVAKEEVPGGSTPSQYRFPEGFREVQDLIEYRNMNFAIGNIFKACYRMDNCVHSDAIYDLNKILWFAKRELDRIQGVPEDASV